MSGPGLSMFPGYPCSSFPTSINLNFLKFVSPSSSTTRIPPANTQTVLEQAALSFCGLSSPSVNAPWGPQAILTLRSYMGDHQQLAELEVSQHLQALEKSSAISPEKT